MTTSTIARLRDHIDAIRSEIEPIARQLRSLESDLAQVESLHFIAENGIAADDVEMDDEDGKPQFGCVDEFAEWLGRESKKPWVSWNGRIYRTTDLLEGSMPETKGRTADLPKTKPEDTK